jgi:hypothetical protein
MFTFDDFFSLPAIPITGAQGKTVQHCYKNGTVEFVYNPHGYRTHDFNQVNSEYILVAGCSLTEGHGLHLEQTWAKLLEQSLNIPVINLAKIGSNAEFVGQNLSNWLRSDRKKPQAIVVQWPNPFRQTHWVRKQARFVLNQTADELFKLKVTHGQEYFYLPWVQNIINLNCLAKFLNIPIIHLALESTESVLPALDTLKNYSIPIHLDLKESGQTWHFDNEALDSLHHSERCTQQWTKRILKLLESVL